MTKRKTTEPAVQPQPRYTVTNCNFTAQTAPANEHTRDAVIAIAKAAEANAVAIGKLADALKGGNATMETGLRIGG